MRARIDRIFVIWRKLGIALVEANSMRQWIPSYLAIMLNQSLAVADKNKAADAADQTGQNRRNGTGAPALV
jgi:hypothetical protein